MCWMNGGGVDCLGYMKPSSYGILPVLSDLSVGPQGDAKKFLLVLLLLAVKNVLEAALGPFESMLGGGDDAALPPDLFPLLLSSMAENVCPSDWRASTRMVAGMCICSRLRDGSRADSYVWASRPTFVTPIASHWRVSGGPDETQRWTPDMTGCRVYLDFVEGDGLSTVVFLRGLGIIGHLYLSSPFADPW